MSRKIGFVPQHWALSRHVISAGMFLESLYPRTYSNLCRKLSLTMSSMKVVRNCLTAFLKVLFEGNITWAKVIWTWSEILLKDLGHCKLQCFPSSDYSRISDYFKKPICLLPVLVLKFPLKSIFELRSDSGRNNVIIFEIERKNEIERRKNET